VRKNTELRAAQLGLANVKFLPVQPREQLFQMLAAADICLITQQRTVADIVFPSRTATFMAAGCPVIASVNAASAVASTVEQSGAGLVVAPEEPEPLFEAIAKLQGDPARRSEMSEAGRRFAEEHWDEKTILPGMESELLRIANSKSDTEIESSPALDLQGRIQ
jgi:colanic acid biosynthesis glycosyl transferase WcaI